MLRKFLSFLVILLPVVFVNGVYASQAPTTNTSMQGFKTDPWATQADPITSKIMDDASKAQADSVKTVDQITNDVVQENAQNAAKESAGSSSKASSTASLPLIATENFMFSPRSFSPSTKTYEQGAGNIAIMIADLVRLMLIAISSIAVLSIAAWGAMMAVSGGNTDRVSKGKAILLHSVQALALSLSAYLIIRFVSWVIG